MALLICKYPGECKFIQCGDNMLPLLPANSICKSFPKYAICSFPGITHISEKMLFAAYKGEI